jgi:hypothetical protein
MQLRTWISRNLRHATLLDCVRTREDTIARMTTQRKRLSHRAAELREAKAQTESAFNSQIRDYDSSYMSQAVEHERLITTLEQKLKRQC